MKRTILSIVVLAIALVAQAAGFVGSTYENGKSYYLFNVYQQKFVKSATSDAITLGSKEDTPLSITISNGKWQTYTLSTVEEGYNLKTSDGMALMFDAGTSCTTGSLSEGFNADKAIWKLITADEYNAYKAKKRFSVAALNVDGMPYSVKIAGVYDLKLNEDAKEGPGATAIGHKMKTMGWDVVGLSEDFNYHSEIWNEAWNNGKNDANGQCYNATTHRGGISLSAGSYFQFAGQKTIFDTDGLCLYYNTNTVNQSLLESSESWTAWNEHNGYTGDGADGLIDKGFRYYTVKLSDGTMFDLYILHMDAEITEGDLAARESQLIQLANAIKASSNKRPIIVMGDTNCRYTRDRVKAKFIDLLEADSRFTVKDPWVMYGRNGKYPTYYTTTEEQLANAIGATENGYRKGEVVDKIFYINNTESDIRIEAETYCQDLSFINESGEPLADHWPCVAEFSYHNYDPAIDDVSEDLNGKYYLRNVATGYYLKAGGWWGTQAVVGDYGTAMNVELADGKYTLESSFGKLYLNNEGAPYMDGAEAQQWDVLQKGKYYVLCCQAGALAVTNDCIYGPNKKVVGISALNADDPKQQWELLTANDLRIEMLGASESKPYNCTHLLPGANFDRNDGNVASSYTTTKTEAKSTVSFNVGGLNAENGNYNFKVSTTKKDGWFGECNNTWTFTKSVSGLPTGMYKVTFQGFYNEANGSGTNKGAYAINNGTVNYMKTVLESGQTASVFSGGESVQNKTYFPTSQEGASYYFNKGCYLNETTVKITDGTLTIKIYKTEHTASNTSDTYFDNFQIYYLGGGDQNYQEETLIEDGDMLVLTGTWTDKQNDLDKVLAKKSYQAVKLTDATIDSPLEINNLGNNALIYADAGNTSNTQNVIVDGKCSNLVITDKVNFKALDGFTASQVTYNRNNVKGYNTVCMPFDYEAEDLGSVYTLQRIYDNEGITTLSFAEETGTIAAGTPVLAYTEDENWRLKLTDKGVVASPIEASGTNALIGSFVKETIGTGYYKLNSTGTEFTKSTAKSTVTPFRFYVDATGVDAKSISFQFESGEETSLEEILQNPETKVTETYDLLGRKVLKVTTPGIYVRDGKKVMMK